MGFLDSLFAAPGSSYRRAQENQEADIASQLAELFKQFSPQLQQQIAWAAQTQPMFQQALMQAVNQLGGAGVQANINQFAAGANERAQQTAQQQQMALLNGGASPNTIAATNLGATNAARSATNQYAAQVQSPEAMAQRSAQMAQLLRQGMDPVALHSALGLAQGIYGRPKVSVGQSAIGGIGSLIGGLAGGPAGGLLGGLFGGGSGGGTQGNMQQGANNMGDAFSFGGW